MSNLKETVTELESELNMEVKNEVSVGIGYTCSYDGQPSNGS